MEPMVNIALRAARKAGELIARAADRPDLIRIDEKGRNDFVTETDRAAEKEIIYHLRKAYPDHRIVGEESGVLEGTDDNNYEWIVDPLDGTTNFIRGIPHYAVSIAFRHRGRLEHAVVYDPMREELFTATRGNGAVLDEHKIRVSGNKDLDRALIGTGFPYRQADMELDAYLAMLGKVVKNSSGVRRPGAAALDLCYVACGRLDAFFETGLQPWDLAAGTLIIREAGGIVSALNGGENHLETGHVLAGTPRIYRALAKLCAKEIKALVG